MITNSILRAAVYVNKMLKCAKPADLPVHEVTKFEFVVKLDPRLLCYYFARTICLYVFESVKSTGWKRR